MTDSDKGVSIQLGGGNVVFRPLRDLITRWRGRLPAQDTDLRALYSLRMPNDDYAPGQITSP
ncbi:hypothetical protein [Streptomyces sp. NPDC014734]|uniref:hypothetical protein n=1 Tax=Streptomyces sp. NPDC014734 TaxID=3364886 RepID=UPI0036FCC974